jgi:hypothetical protein
MRLKVQSRPLTRLDLILNEELFIYNTRKGTF